MPYKKYWKKLSKKRKSNKKKSKKINLLINKMIMEEHQLLQGYKHMLEMQVKYHNISCHLLLIMVLVKKPIRKCLLNMKNKPFRYSS